MSISNCQSLGFETSTAPCPLLADLVSNLTPPGQLTRERASLDGVGLERDTYAILARLRFQLRRGNLAFRSAQSEGWWARSDLNRGPSDYESLALTN